MTFSSEDSSGRSVFIKSASNSTSVSREIHYHDENGKTYRIEMFEVDQLAPNIKIAIAPVMNTDGLIYIDMDRDTRAIFDDIVLLQSYRDFYLRPVATFINNTCTRVYFEEVTEEYCDKKLADFIQKHSG